MWGVVIMVVILFYLIERYSIDNAFSGVSYDILPSKVFLEPDEPFQITTKISNNKSFTVPFLQVAENLPSGMQIRGSGYFVGDVFVREDSPKKKFFEINNAGQTTQVLQYSTYLKARSVLNRTIAVSMPNRGKYYFSGAYLTGGDFCGLSTSAQNFPLLKELMVMPRRVNIDALSDSVGGFLGEVSVNRFIMEDPILTLGYGDYTGREPQRAISWTQSAKMNRMMVKKYDHTLEPCLMVLLNTAGGSHEELETCYSITRTICDDLEQRGIRYSYLSNIMDTNHEGIRDLIPEGLGESHLYAVLEGLARAGYTSSEPFADMLDRAYDFAEMGCTLVLITSKRRSDYDELLRRFSDMKGGKAIVYTPEEVSGWK